MRCLGPGGRSSSEVSGHTRCPLPPTHTRMHVLSSTCCPTSSVAQGTPRQFATILRRKSRHQRKENRCQWVLSHWRSTSKRWSRTTQPYTGGAAMSLGKARRGDTRCSSARTSAREPMEASTATSASVSAQITHSTFEGSGWSCQEAVQRSAQQIRRLHQIFINDHCMMSPHDTIHQFKGASSSKSNLFSLCCFKYDKL